MDERAAIAALRLYLSQFVQHVLDSARLDVGQAAAEDGFGYFVGGRVTHGLPGGEGGNQLYVGAFRVDVRGMLRQDGADESAKRVKVGFVARLAIGSDEQVVDAGEMHGGYD